MMKEGSFRDDQASWLPLLERRTGHRHYKAVKPFEGWCCLLPPAIARQNDESCTGPAAAGGSTCVRG